jgi:hypothetical protein
LRCLAASDEQYVLLALSTIFKNGRYGGQYVYNQTPSGGQGVSGHGGCLNVFLLLYRLEGIKADSADP